MGGSWGGEEGGGWGFMVGLMVRFVRGVVGEGMVVVGDLGWGLGMVGRWGKRHGDGS